jgi:gliding motility-associated lipoprotein GldD
MGYFNIEIPQKNEYKHFSGSAPFEFDISSLARISLKDSVNHPYYYNLEYPQWKATIHFTYLPVQNDLKRLIDEEHRRKEKHLQLAASISDSIYIFPVKHVSATVFNINGTKTATPLQFFITDSTKHFFRGSLYFYHTPNNDSIQPIIQYIKKDVRRLIRSFNWK